MKQQGIVHIVDDNVAVRQALAFLMRSAQLDARVYASAEVFLDEYTPSTADCLLLDVRMPGMSGMELHKVLNQQGIKPPIIFITGHGDVSMAVDAMQMGAVDFIEKPFDNEVLLEKINRVLMQSDKYHSLPAGHAQNVRLLAQLTPREQEVLDLLVAGKPNKVIATRLAISTRTVEVHRANIMSKLQAHSLADLVRIRLLG